MKQNTTTLFQLSLITSGLFTFSLSSALAQYSSNGGYAISDGSIAVGGEAYATATNGIATGTSAVATGDNLTRKNFETRLEVIKALEQQIQAKNAEISEAQNTIRTKQNNIININQEIARITAREKELAQKLVEYRRLSANKTSAETIRDEYRQTISIQEPKYNQLIDSNGHSKYENFGHILSRLNWQDLNQPNGNTQLRDNLRSRIETDFSDLLSSYSDEQYQQLIDGYIAREASSAPSTQELIKYIENKNTIRLSIGGVRNTLIFPFVFDTEDKITLTAENFRLNYIDYNEINNLAYKDNDRREKNENTVKEVISTLHFLFAHQNPNSISSYLTQTYSDPQGYNAHAIPLKFVNRLPPVNKAIKFQDYFLTNYTINKDLIVKAAFNNQSTEIAQFQSGKAKLTEIKNSIDKTKQDSWWFDLNEYETKLTNILDFYEKVDKFISDKAELQAELAKNINDRNQTRINELNSNIIQNKRIIDEEIEDKENYLDTMHIAYRQEILDQEFAEAKQMVREIYDRTRADILTYDDKHPIIQETKRKVQELSSEIIQAKNSLRYQEEEILRLEREIAKLGLSAEDENLAEKKREQQTLLEQKQTEINIQRTALEQKEEELAALHQQLNTTPLNGLGTNAMAEGFQAFASGENAIAYGTQALATGNNAIALGANSQAINTGAIAIGEGAVAQGIGSVAMGQGSIATQDYEFSVGSATQKRRITNVENATISDSSHEAVTGQQLKAVADILGATITNNTLNVEYPYYDLGMRKTTNNIKIVLESLINGGIHRNGNTITQIQTVENPFLAINSNQSSAQARGSESIAIGGGAMAQALNSVAIGSGSVANLENEFSVGNLQQGLTRRITNVADGIADNDVANMKQLSVLSQQLKQEVKQLEKRMIGGIAGAYAAAGLPSANFAGDHMLSVASGGYYNQAAVAIGYSRLSDNGRISIKFSGSVSTTGSVGGSFGVGLRF